MLTRLNPELELLDNNESMTHILYHFPCKDGFGAAWAYHNYMMQRSTTKGSKVMYHPSSHDGKAVLALLERSSLKNESVIFLDYCPKRPLLEKVHSIAKSCEVWDHHKTALDDCGDLPYVHLDMKRSGAGIAWDVFVQTPRPLLINCIEDGDLWRWEVPNSNEILIVLEGKRFDFNLWSEYSKQLQDPDLLKEIITMGRYYIEYRARVTRSLTSRNKIHKLIVGPNKLEIPAVNAGIFQSGIGNILSTKIAPYAAAIYYTPNGKRTLYSLRSDKHRSNAPDVEQLAKYYGGGGHRNAAAFAIERGTSPLEPTFAEYTDHELTLIDSVLDSCIYVNQPDISGIDTVIEPITVSY